MDYKQVSKHNTVESCWVILYDNVYDVTSFLPNHPGGRKIIMQLAGKDATEEYDPVHPPGTLEESLDSSAKLGQIDKATLPPEQEISSVTGSSSPEASSDPPPLESLLNLDDVEREATKLLSKKAWAYYYSGADDLRTKALNSSVYGQLLLRPRVFVDCTRCDTSTTFLGHRLQMPFFVSPAAMARLAHPTGEQGIAAACAKFGAAQIVSNNASMTPEQIVENAPEDQVFGWQLYVQTERSKSENMLARISKLPNYKFIVLTLDAPVPGKREDDERAKNEGAPLRASVQQQTDDAAQNSTSQDGGLGKALFAGTAADLTWRTTLPWLAQHTSLPIVLKGVQTHEDAYLAAQHAPQVQSIILSNHGGRAADTAPPPLMTLLEIRKYCPHVLSKVDVLLDGGIRRGTDVVKALALGAKAVGLGRAPLWGLGVGGVQGVERVFTILKEETETAMRLLGAESVSALTARHVNTRALDRDVYDGPSGVDVLALRSKL